jgi:hypothetical protein
VQALSAAADALEAALLAAGWQPLPQGSAWYSKRFQWEPAAAAAHSAEPGGRPAAQRTSQRPTDSSGRPAPRRTEPSQRFKREATAWPQDGRERWRCEIKWDAGYLNSRFQAVVYPPGGKPGRPAAASKPFKLTLRGEPDPHSERYRAEARALATAMQTAGWDPIGRGNAWYAERFVWRGDGEPPERVDPLSSEAVSSD